MISQIIFLSGYVSVSKLRMLWEKRLDIYNVRVSGATRRNRFETRFSHLHVANDANFHPLVKFSKLRPLVSILNERCQKHVPNETCFTVDGSMVSYYGGPGCKRYIREKPIRFG